MSRIDIPRAFMAGVPVDFARRAVLAGTIALMGGGAALGESLLLPGGASAQVTAPAVVLGSGGGGSMSGDIRARATIGQGTAGRATGSPHRAGIGLWYLVSDDDGTLLGAEGPPLPGLFHLAPNRPNPFRPMTRIAFSNPVEGRVVLRVFDVAGRIVATLVDRRLSEGLHEVEFRPEHLASGVYFYRLETAGKVALRRMVLLR